jgi:hypothetical protein
MERHAARTRRAPLVAGLLLLALATGARADSDIPKYESSLGIGGAKSFEDHVFRLPGDSPSTPTVFLDLGLRENFQETLAFGVHVYGVTEKTEEFNVVVVGQSLPQAARFTLNVAHVGLDVRYQVEMGAVRPYLVLAINYVTGTAKDPSTESLTLSGVSFGGGPGVQYDFNRHIAVAVEGLYLTGTASWNQVPFANSSSDSFDPSLAAGAAMFVYRWGS